MNAARDAAVPFESELYGAPQVEGPDAFGNSRYDRTYGLGYIKIKWNASGVISLQPTASCFRYNKSLETTWEDAASTNWFQLVNSEYIKQVRFRECVSGCLKRISAVCFVTNMRRSQWFGATDGTIRSIAAPDGYCIHSIHGFNDDEACRSLGAYFVPLPLLVVERSGCTWVGDSDVIGRVPFDKKSDVYAWLRPASVRAMLVEARRYLECVEFLDRTEYEPYLAVTDTALSPGQTLVELVDGELITAIRACVANGRISAVQFETTHRTTEWFGELAEDGDIQVRSVDDVPTATHIGGIFSMRGSDGIESIGVEFCKPK